MPILSVIITTYNQEKYIAEAIEGVLSQKDIPEFEIVVGNDCSTDKTGETIEEYSKKYPDIIKVLKREKNLGLQQNLKDCFDNCSGDYIAICEGDDYWIDNHKLKKQYEILKKSNNALFCFTDIYIKDEISGKTKLKRHFKSMKKKLSSTVTFKDLIEYQNPIANFSCCMYKKEAIRLIPESFWKSNAADFLFHMYLLDNSNAIFLKDVCSVYRLNNNSIYASISNEQKVLNKIKKIFVYDETFNYKYKKSFYILLRKSVCELLKEKILFSFNIPLLKKKINISKMPIE